MKMKTAYGLMSAVFMGMAFVSAWRRQPIDEIRILLWAIICQLNAMEKS